MYEQRMRRRCFGNACIRCIISTSATLTALKPEKTNKDRLLNYILSPYSY